MENYKLLIYSAVALAIAFVSDFLFKTAVRSSLIKRKDKYEVVDSVIQLVAVSVAISNLILYVLICFGYDGLFAAVVSIAGTFIVIGFPVLCRFLHNFYEFLVVSTSLSIIKGKMNVYKTEGLTDDMKKLCSLAYLSMAMLPYPSVFYKLALRKLNKIELICGKPISRYELYLRSDCFENM